MSLRDIGVDADLERLYRLLLLMPVPTVARAAEGLGLAPDVVDAQLDRLVELGLVRLRDGALVVIEPGSAVGSLIERVEDDLLARFRRVISTRSDVADLTRSVARAGESATATDAIERIEDLHVLRDRIEELSFFARHTNDLLQSGGVMTAEGLQLARPLDERTLRRGVRMRLVREERILADADARQYLLDLVALGAQVRIVSEPLHRMLLFDGSVAVVPIDPQRPAKGGLVVREPALIAGFREMFEHVWADAGELTEVLNADPTDEPSAPDRRLLQLMLDGVTDEVAARELAMSTRHLRRQVTRLFAELGVTNRFAAGVQAHRRGWV